jgi:hypothetical protein
VIAFEMDTAPALAALQQEIESLPPRLMLKASSVLRPMVYAALNTSLQKYFSGSPGARARRRDAYVAIRKSVQLRACLTSGCRER